MPFKFLVFWWKWQLWNSPNTVNRCNWGPADWLTNGTERQRPDGHDRVDCLSGWRPRFRLNYNELTNRAALSSSGVFSSTVLLMQCVRFQGERIFGFVATGCSQVIRSGVCSCITSGSTLQAMSSEKRNCGLENWSTWIGNGLLWKHFLWGDTEKLHSLLWSPAFQW